jgi:hypothetical protein
MGSTLEAQKKKAPKPKREKYHRDTWSDMPEKPTLPRIYAGSKGPQHLIYRVPKDGKPPVEKGPWKEGGPNELDRMFEASDGGIARNTRVF